MTSFSDDFARADSTDLGANWVEVSGDWSIVSQQLSPGAAGGTIILRAAGAMASNDNFAQATIAATAVASQGVWCRGNSNISQGYLFRNNGSSWDLFSVVGGSFTVIGTYAVAAAANDIMKVQAVGSTITAYVNGVQRISVVNSAVATGTSVGIRSDSTSGVRYDNFSAGDVVNGATLGIASEVDAAQAFAGSKSATLSPAASIEAAQQLTGAKAATLGIASATETAQALTGSKTATLGVATAVEAAQPLMGSKAAVLSTAAASEAAQQLAGAKSATLGIAVETAAAQPLTGAKTATLPVATEIETAQPFVGTMSQTLGVAGAAETAMPLVGAKTATLAPALEVDTARVLARQSTVVPSPERTFTIPAEGRRLTVVAEARTLTVRR